MPVKPIESRSIKVDIAIQERRADSYSGEDVGKTSLTIPLPAEAGAIGKAVAGAIEQLARNTDLFRGPVPVVIDADLAVS